MKTNRQIFEEGLHNILDNESLSVEELHSSIQEYISSSKKINLYGFVQKSLSSSSHYSHYSRCMGMEEAALNVCQTYALILCSSSNPRIPVLLHLLSTHAQAEKKALWGWHLTLMKAGSLVMRCIFESITKHPETANILIQTYPECLLEDNMGGIDVVTLLNLSVRNNYLQTLPMLLHAAKEFKMHDGTNLYSSFPSLLILARSTECMNILLEHGANLYKPEQDSTRTPIGYFRTHHSTSNRFEKVKLFLDLLEEKSLDRNYLLSCVSAEGLSLEYLPAQFRDDTEIVKKAVEENSEALTHASERIKALLTTKLAERSALPDEVMSLITSQISVVDQLNLLVALGKISQFSLQKHKDHADLIDELEEFKTSRYTTGAHQERLTCLIKKVKASNNIREAYSAIGDALLELAPRCFMFFSSTKPLSKHKSSRLGNFLKKLMPSSRTGATPVYAANQSDL